MQRSPDSAVGDFNRRIAQHKRAIRRHKAQLQEVAEAKRRYLERLSQFGVEYVERGVERNSHGQR